MGPRQIILSAVVPGLLAAVLLLAPALFFRRRDRDDQASEPHRATRLSWLVVLLIAASVALGSYAWQSRLDLWPAQAQYRFPPAAIIAAIVGLTVALLSHASRTPVLAPLTALAGALVAWTFLSLLHHTLISETARWTWIALSGLLAAAHSLTLERVARNLPAWRAPLLLTALAGTLALGATMSFANAPLVLGPAAAVLAAAMLAAIINPHAALMPGVPSTLALLIVATITFANWFGSTERWSMYALLAAAPLAAGLCLLPPIARRGPNARLAAALLASLTLAGTQAARAIPPLLKSMSQPPDAYDR